MSILVVAPNNEQKSPLEFESALAQRLCTSVGDEMVLAFLQALSHDLMKKPQAQTHPELVALGFWLRKSNLLSLLNTLDNRVYKPLGLVVHYAPNNVDTMFIYSWVCSLLMGNKNIIRLGSKSSGIKTLVLDMLNDLFAKQEYKTIANTNYFVQFPHESTEGRNLALQADSRVIWGGNESVKRIRSIPAKATTRDIVFADRYSAMVIHGEELTADNVDNLASAIYRDVESFEQQACSSPRILFWVGDKSTFTSLVEQVGLRGNSTELGITVKTEHLVLSQYLAAKGFTNGVIARGTVIWLTATEAEQGIDDAMAAHNGQGVVLCYFVDSLAQIKPFIREKMQTLAYWGVDKAELVKFITQPSITGIERLVPVGEALNFSPIWDGYELLPQLAKSVDVK